MGTGATIAIDGVHYKLSEDFLSQVLATAVEGACSYWADVRSDYEGDPTAEDRAGDFDLSDYIEDDAEANGEGGPGYKSASFLVSGDASQGGTLDHDGVADAIERIASGEADVPPAVREIIVAAVQNDDASDIDAEAADCIVQIGLFDEIVYS